MIQLCILETPFLIQLDSSGEPWKSCMQNEAIHLLLCNKEYVTIEQLHQQTCLLKLDDKAKKEEFERQLFAVSD